MSINPTSTTIITPTVTTTSDEIINDSTFIVTSVKTLEDIKKLNTNELIEFLKEQDVLHLIKEDFDIINDERITGYIFIDMKLEDFLSYGLKRAPASSLAKFAKECRERMIFSDKNLKDSIKDDREGTFKFERPVFNFENVSDIGQQRSHSMFNGGNEFTPNGSVRKIRRARSRRRN